MFWLLGELHTANVQTKKSSHHVSPPQSSTNGNGMPTVTFILLREL